jgi:hypothetical protein
LILQILNPFLQFFIFLGGFFINCFILFIFILEHFIVILSQFELSFRFPQTLILCIDLIKDIISILIELPKPIDFILELADFQVRSLVGICWGTSIVVLLQVVDKAFLLCKFLVFLFNVVTFLLDFIFEVEVFFFVFLKLDLEVLDFGIFLSGTFEIAVACSLSLFGLLRGKVGGRSHLLHFVELFIEDALSRILFVGFGLVSY